jgi:2-C-methyl-D-erythritol 4-phosphate cytidylyltransferase
MDESREVWAVLVAAGQGSRFGRPKHDVELDGEPLWVHAERALRAGGIDEVVIVGDVPGGIEGGPRRRDSVARGLERVPVEVELVLVHDAARPLASPELVARVIQRLSVGDVAGVVPAVPVTDTLKQTEGDAVVRTVDRSSLVAVQTPQGFIASVLRRAHAAGDDNAGDDAMLVEAIGERVAVVAGEPTNLKITYPGDLELAATFRSIRHG